MSVQTVNTLANYVLPSTPASSNAPNYHLGIPRPNQTPQQTIVLVMENDQSISASIQDAAFLVTPVASVHQATAEIQDSATGCLIVDCDAFGAQLPDIVETLWKKAIGFQVIAVSERTEARAIQQALRQGACDYCTKPFKPGALSAAIQRACERDTSGEQSPYIVRSRMATLTDREREVVECCLRGTNTKVIAKELDVTYQTIDKHRKKALRKMRIGSMVELANVLNETTLSALGYRHQISI